MLESYGLNLEYIVIGLAGLILILLLLMINLKISFKRLKRRYDVFMSGDNARSLEDKLANGFLNVDGVMVENQMIKVALKKLNRSQRASFARMGLVHYDAFEKTSGELSFALALLNEEYNGVVINSVYSQRGGCYVYAKEIVDGESLKVLTKEERIALEDAMDIDEI